MRIELEFFDKNGNRDPNGLYFRGVDAVEKGTNSEVIADEWLRVVVTGGHALYTGYWDVMEGLGVSNTGLIDSRKYDPKMLPPNKDHHQVPAGARMIRLVGERSSAAVQVTARLLPKGK